MQHKGPVSGSSLVPGLKATTIPISKPIIKLNHENLVHIAKCKICFIPQKSGHYFHREQCISCLYAQDHGGKKKKGISSKDEKYLAT